MEFKAFKMDGLGNDFVIIDQRAKTINLSKENIIKICSRDFIGCDQLIYIHKNKDNKDRLAFYNSDGSISGACGNGTRCVAKLLSKEYKKEKIDLETSSGILHSSILDENLVETNIGKPSMKWNEIPLIKIMNTKDLQISIKDIKGNNFVGGIAINVGNPHIIFFVENNENFKIENIGPEIEQHQYFPEKCNVTIATIKNKNLINVKAWERGAGLTKACGTAACATAYAGFVTKKTSDNVDIKFTTGILSIRIDQNNSIFMKGPVSNIKEIKVNL
mgnify:CR=1 FL=1|jgi:diaminopimelate epimerase|tara:strand:- start:3487 stop:4311 length:825 start_codon:yes stop_codon:yes gene_type:complete